MPGKVSKNIYEALCYKDATIGKSMRFLHSNLKITRVVQFHHVWLIFMERYYRFEPPQISVDRW